MNGANATVAVPGGDITADGTYYWQAKATDNQSVSSAFSASRSFTVDTTAPPVPTVDSGPGNSSTSGKDVTFTYSDTEGGVTFETQIDGLGWNANASPKSYTNLSDGSHTFEVRAKDALGNTSNPRTRTWTVDAIAPPSATIDSGPAGSSTSGKNVSFGFSDTEGTATFEVQIDGGGFASASSPKAYTNLSDGSHTFQVRALDDYGNVSGVTSRTWTVDAVAPPAPTIDSGPAAASTTGDSVSFGYSDTEGTATLEVQIDGGGYVSAASPKAYTSLSDGSHTFSVRAFDAYGNTSAVTSRTWTVDAIAPPQPTIDSGPGNSSTSGKNVSFGFSDTEGTATFETQIDGAGWNANTSPKSYTNLSDGSHTFEVRALDAYGNTSAPRSRTWTVDAIAPPSATIDSGPAGSSTSGKNVSFGFSDTEGTATFEVQIDGGGFASDSSPKAYTNLSDGSHTFQVRALDAYGNVSGTTSRTWTVDAVAPPVPSIDSGPAAASTSGKNVSFGFSDTEGGSTFEVQIDNGGYGTAASPKAYTNLSDGSHTFDVRAVDAYGNTSASTTRTWTVDAIAPPAPSIDTGPSGGSTTGKNVSFAFSDSEGTATFEVQLDGTGYVAATSPQALTNLSDGSHTFAIRALDGYGNVSSATSRTWTVDAVAPPAPTFDSGPAGGSTSGKNVSFDFSDTEGGVTFEAQLDGGGYSSVTSPQALTNLSDGSHTFQVRAVDAYGNVSSVASRTWTVDAIAPAVPTIDSGPAAASTTGKSVSFGFSDTEGTATFEVQIDGGGYTSSASPKAYPNLADGSHTFNVRALDAYGNTSASATRTWTVDAVAPPAPTIDSGPGRRVHHGQERQLRLQRQRGQRDARDPDRQRRLRRRVQPAGVREPERRLAHLRRPRARRLRQRLHRHVADVDGRRDAAGPPDDRQRPRRRLHLRQERQLRLLRHGRHRDVRSPDRRRRLHQLHLAEGLHEPRRRLAHLPRPRGGRATATRARPSRARGRWTRSRRPLRRSTAARPPRAPPARTSASASPTRKAPRRSKSRSTAAATPAPPRRRPTRTSPTARTPSTSARSTATATSRAPPTRTWTVDAVAPPVPSIDSGPAAAGTSGKNVSFGFSDTEGTATFEVQIDGGGYTSSTRPKAYTNLADGSHTFDVRALDAYGNTSSATTPHLDGRRSRAAGPEHRQRPRRRQHDRQERQLRLLRHGRHRDVRESRSTAAATSPRPRRSRSTTSPTARTPSTSARSTPTATSPASRAARGRSTRSRRRPRRSTAAPPQRAPPARTSASASPTRKAPRRSWCRSTAAATPAPPPRRPTPT